MDTFSDFLPKLSGTTDRQVSSETNQCSPTDPLSSTCGTNHNYIPEFVPSPSSKTNYHLSGVPVPFQLL
jgi:hypothetical protein